MLVIGANYLKHLDEMGIKPAQRPHAFLKSWNALIGATDPIQLPAVTRQLDHEVEQVAVVGSTLAPGEDPQSCILGYTVENEVSGRDLQPAPPVSARTCSQPKGSSISTRWDPGLSLRMNVPQANPT